MIKSEVGRGGKESPIYRIFLLYKIAYKRIVESKTHREIAEDLNFSEQYIRKRWMDIKRVNKHTTDTIANV